MKITAEKLLNKAVAGTYDIMPGGTIWSSGDDSTSLDKFEFPKDYSKIVELAYHYFRTDPIVSTTVTKVLDIGFRNYSLKRRQCTDEEFRVYSSVDVQMMLHLRDLGLEYLLSGLVVPEITWKTTKGKELHPELGDKDYSIPEVLWKRDPLSLRLRRTPIPNRVFVLAVPSAEDIYFITNNGKYSDGTKDQETWNLLWKNYRAYCMAIKRGVKEFPLPDAYVIRRNVLPDSAYPIPYLMPALEPLQHKRNLRKMDYATAARVIAAIMLVRIGNDEYPLTSEDVDVVNDLRNQFLWRGRSGNFERIFQLFSNHTVDISWIMPDVTALLDDGKYESVNLDILYALGFPRIMLTGETARTGTSQAEFALLSPAETIKAIREVTVPWAREVYQQMKERNKFKNLPEPGWAEIRMYDLEKLMTIAELVYAQGALSKTTLASLAGFDFENDELPLRIKEAEWFKKAGIPEYPATPFDKPDGADSGNQKEGTSNDQKPKKTN